MALTADVNYQVKAGTVETRNCKGGAADVLYKGALLNFGTDGYVKVAADVSGETFAGICKKKVTEDATHKDVEVEFGVIRVAHSGAAQTDVGAFFYATADDTLADSATHVRAAGFCVDWESGYVWIDTRISNYS